jgi:hypothetical protein
MPFVNTKYILAGGIDTPILATAQANEIGGSEYSDVGHRRELSGNDKTKGLFGEQQQHYFLPELERKLNGTPRTSQYRNEGWSKAVLEVVGGVVGKVWELCKTSAF